MRYKSFAIVALSIGAVHWPGYGASELTLSDGSSIPFTTTFPTMRVVVDSPGRKIVKAQSDVEACIYISIDRQLETESFVPESILRDILEDPDLTLKGEEGDWPHLENAGEFDGHLLGFAVREMDVGTVSFFMIAHRDVFQSSKRDFWVVISEFELPSLIKSAEQVIDTKLVIGAILLLVVNVRFLWKAFGKYALMTSIDEPEFET